LRKFHPALWAGAWQGGNQGCIGSRERTVQIGDRIPQQGPAVIAATSVLNLRQRLIGFHHPAGDVKPHRGFRTLRLPDRGFRRSQSAELPIEAGTLLKTLTADGTLSQVGVHGRQLRRWLRPAASSVVKLRYLVRLQMFAGRLVQNSASSEYNDFAPRKPSKSGYPGSRNYRRSFNI
jgi:hypothetical protein